MTDVTKELCDHCKTTVRLFGTKISPEHESRIKDYCVLYHNIGNPDTFRTEDGLEFEFPATAWGTPKLVHKKQE